MQNRTSKPQFPTRLFTNPFVTNNPNILGDLGLIAPTTRFAVKVEGVRGLNPV